MDYIVMSIWAISVSLPNYKMTQVLHYDLPKSIHLAFPIAFLSCPHSHCYCTSIDFYGVFIDLSRPGAMIEDNSPVTEGTTAIDDLNIGYCKYGRGPNSVLCICGAVGQFTQE